MVRDLQYVDVELAVGVQEVACFESFEDVVGVSVSSEQDGLSIYSSRGAGLKSPKDLSFLKIISGRIGDAARPRWEWRQ